MKHIRLFSGFLGSLLLRILLSAMIGTVLLSLVYMLPVAPIEKNLEKSAPVFDREGMYLSLYTWCTSQLDSTTDSLMLLISACDTGENRLVQAMSGTRNTLSAADTCSNGLAEHYGSDIPFDGTEPYYQYWHGYQIFLRPVLSLMSYQNIRLMNGILQTALLLILCILLRKSGFGWCILPLLASVAMIMPIVIAHSLQFSCCYYIMLLGSIAILLKQDVLDRTDGILFLYMGIATAYFDFLTYPAATLGIPAAVYFCIRKTASFRDTFCRGVKICFSWGIGYIGMWSAKWIIGSLVLGQNILTLASEKLLERSSANVFAGKTLMMTFYVTLSTNIKAFIRTPATLFLVVYFVVLLILALHDHKKYTYRISQAMQSVFPFFVLACIPIVWYLCTANHSFIHNWFTHKALVASAFAATASLCKFRKDIRAQ